MNDDDLDRLYPKWNCPVCGDWFHMPWKFCKCPLPVDLRSGDVLTPDGKFHRIRLNLSRLPWWRRLLRWLRNIPNGE